MKDLEDSDAVQKVQYMRQACCALRTGRDSCGSVVLVMLDCDSCGSGKCSPCNVRLWCVLAVFSIWLLMGSHEFV